MDECSPGEKQNPLFLLLRNLLCRSFGDRRGARVVAEEMTRVQPHKASGFMRLAYDSFVLGYAEEAVEALKKAVSLEPSVLTDPSHVDTITAKLGISGASELLSIRPHNGSTKAATKSPQKRFLFVSGVPRSGTSALGRLLGLAPGVVIYNELLSHKRPYSPRAFDGDFVADTSRGRNQERVFLDALQRSEHADYLGDKRPNFMHLAPNTFDEFKEASLTVVHIVRRVEDVASSFHSRAIDPSDERWSPAVNGADAEIQTLVQEKYILGSMSNDLHHGHRVVLVAYDRIFSDRNVVLTIFELLGIKISNEAEERLANFVRQAQNRVLEPVRNPAERSARVTGAGIADLNELWMRLSAGTLLATESGIEPLS